MVKDKNEQRICISCFFDENFPGVIIEENGRCNHCNSGEFKEKVSKLTHSNVEQLRIVSSQIREERKNKGSKYDCIIGASGGLDSSYVVYIAKKIFDNNPLVVSYANDFTILNKGTV